jgi:pilus assembly protein CpaF
VDARDAGLERLADELRERLVRSAAEEGGEAAQRVAALVEREAGLLSEQERASLRRIVSERSLGLGPLEPLLADPHVEEVMVNGPGRVYVERRGRIEPTAVAFASEAELRHAIERILAPLGRRVDEAEPLCDARLADGSRVNVVLPPLALDGPLLTIRRFRASGFGPHELVACGTLDRALCDLLAACVRARLTILVSGGTGSGKTTTLGALSSFIPDGERIVTIEDAAELRLRQPHVVRLEARPASLEGRGEVPIRRLVRNALRMRPDRIVVGEVRGGEALDMLSAMASGHDGSLSTVHAGSPDEALRRVETLALMAESAPPHAAIRELVADAIDLVVQQRRERDGRRRIVAVGEVVRSVGGVRARELFALRGERPCWRAPLPAELSARLAAEGFDVRRAHPRPVAPEGLSARLAANAFDVRPARSTAARAPEGRPDLLARLEAARRRLRASVAPADAASLPDASASRSPSDAERFA